MIIASINYNANAIRIKKTIINKSIKIPKVQINNKTASCFLPFNSQIKGRPKIKEPTKETDKTKSISIAIGKIKVSSILDSNLSIILTNKTTKTMYKKVPIALRRE